MNEHLELDERRGFTSASNAQADLLCPGRHLAQKEVKEPEQESEYATHGRLIHSVLANRQAAVLGELWDKLTPEQQDTATACHDIEKEVVKTFFGEAEWAQFRERRFWVHVPENGEQSFQHSGRVDVVYRSGPRGLVLEYKTLHGDVPASPSNLQLRDQAVLVSRDLILREVGTAVIQPFVTYNPEVTLYDAEALARAEQEMFERVRRSNDPKSKRIPGDVQCQFCRARPICRQYAVWATSQLPAVPAPPLALPVREWSPEQRATFCEHRARARKWLDECEDEMRRLLAEDPEAIPGWTLKEGAMRAHIDDAQACFDRFQASGGNVQQFMACIEVHKTELERQLRTATGKKGKGLKTALEDLLNGISSYKQNKPSLVRRDD